VTGVETFYICAECSQPRNPRISKNIIVLEESNGNGDIYGFDLSVKTRFPICTNEARQEDVAISGNTIIWVDHRDGGYIYDIYGYDLSAGTEFPVTTIQPPSGPWRGPSIDGNFIVWEDDKEGNWEKYGYNIHGYSLTTKMQFPICADSSQQACPKVSGDIVVWTDNRNGNGDIYGFNLSTKKEFPICTNEAYQGWADICGNIVVWEDERNGNSDVYGYDISTGKEFPVCTGLHEQVKPRVSGTVGNQHNGTLFKPYTLAWSGGINKLLETLVIVSATVNRLYLHLLPAL